VHEKEAMMFVQILKGRVHDRELFAQQGAAWGTELKPTATGWLGATWGVTSENEAFIVARFESAAAAHSNSDRAAQSAWFEKTESAFDAPPTFKDSEDVDLLFGGGSDRAGFVQVMEGRVKDADAFRAAIPDLEVDLKRVRPDLLGATVIWHGGGSFTQVAYFTSEAEARKNETSMAADPSSARFNELLDGPMSFYDLASPEFY
jgi:hypothetical protein